MQECLRRTVHNFQPLRNLRRPDACIVFTACEPTRQPLCDAQPPCQHILTAVIGQRQLSRRPRINATHTARASYTSRLCTSIFRHDATRMHNSRSKTTVFQAWLPQLDRSRTVEGASSRAQVRSWQEQRTFPAICMHVLNVLGLIQSTPRTWHFRRAKVEVYWPSRNGSQSNNTWPLQCACKDICFEDFLDLQNVQRAGNHTPEGWYLAAIHMFPSVTAKT